MSSARRFTTDLSETSILGFYIRPCPMPNFLFTPRSYFTQATACLNLKKNYNYFFSLTAYVTQSTVCLN